jgi:hypothetical protein
VKRIPPTVRVELRSIFVKVPVLVKIATVLDSDELFDPVQLGLHEVVVVQFEEEPFQV